VSGTQNVWHGVTVGNVTTYWKAEAAAMTDGSPTLGNPSVTAAKLTAYLTGSYEIFEDSNLQSQLPGLIARRSSTRSRTRSSSVPARPRRRASSPPSPPPRARRSPPPRAARSPRPRRSTCSRCSTLVPSRYEDSATWVANKATSTPSSRCRPARNGSYFWSDFNAASVTRSWVRRSRSRRHGVGDHLGHGAAILGDFSQFVIYDRIGTRSSSCRTWSTGSGLPTGQRGYIAHKRVGSDVTDVNAFRFLKT
jgi:hypothetical protein